MVLSWDQVRRFLLKTIKAFKQIFHFSSTRCRMDQQTVTLSQSARNIRRRFNRTRLRSHDSQYKKLNHSSIVDYAIIDCAEHHNSSADNHHRGNHHNSQELLPVGLECYQQRLQQHPRSCSGNDDNNASAGKVFVRWLHRGWDNIGAWFLKQNRRIGNRKHRRFATKSNVKHRPRFSTIVVQQHFTASRSLPFRLGHHRTLSCQLDELRTRQHHGHHRARLNTVFVSVHHRVLADWSRRYLRDVEAHRSLPEIFARRRPRTSLGSYVVATCCGTCASQLGTRRLRRCLEGIVLWAALAGRLVDLLHLVLCSGHSRQI